MSAETIDPLLLMLKIVMLIPIKRRATIDYVHLLQSPSSGALLLAPFKLYKIE